MTRSRWEQSGYSDIVAVEVVDGTLSVEFANGDLVRVPSALAGDLRGSSVTFDPDEALSVIIEEGEGSPREITWTQIRAGSDPQFAQHLRDLDAEESKRLGRRLKALREDRGMPQDELAAMVAMQPPQLSKIEAGKHDMKLSTVRALLRALDASLADVSGDDVPEVSLRRLMRQLERAGATRESAQMLLTLVPRRTALALVSRAFGWTREAINSGDFHSAPLAAAVQFKSGSLQQPTESPLIRLAWAVARAGRSATSTEPFRELADGPASVRAELVAAHGDVSLRSLLTWAWANGIPVLPMLGKGGFSASVWADDDGPVIVLKEARDLAAFWLFDLAHELGHIASGHVASDSLVDLSSPTALASNDEQEREANEFALRLLVPGYEELLAEVRRESRGNYLAFKGAVASTAQRHGMNAGLLGMLAAHELTEIGEHKDRWGSATNLAKEDGPGRAVAVETARQRLDLGRLDELDRALVRATVLGD